MPFHEPSPETDGQRQRGGEGERERERHINKTIINYFVSYKFSGQKKTVSRLK